MMTPLFIGGTSMQEVLLVHSWYSRTDERHYQNFYKFPVKLLNYLVIIYFAQ